MVDPEAGCWVRVVARSRRAEPARVNRVAYEYVNCPIPDDLCRLRRCGNPACVNPDHTELATRAEVARSTAKARLTDDDVREILGIGLSQPIAATARRFGVSSPLVHHVLSGLRRADVAPEMARPLRKAAGGE